MRHRKFGRVTHASYPSRCPLCRKLIARGLQVAKTPVGWAHTGCLISAAKKLGNT
jgi:hypothetical protein